MWVGVGHSPGDVLTELAVWKREQTQLTKRQLFLLNFEGFRVDNNFEGLAVVRPCRNMFVGGSCLIHGCLSSTDGGRNWPMSELCQDVHYVAIIFITYYFICGRFG